MINLMPFLYLWFVLAGVVILLAAYRAKLARADNAWLHVSDSEARELNAQATIAKKLDGIDRWGKLLTIIAAIYLVVLTVMFMYQQWVASSSVVSLG